MSNLYCDVESNKKAESEDRSARNSKTFCNQIVQSIKNMMIVDNNGKNRANSHDNDKMSIKAERGDKKTPITPKCSFVRENINLFSKIASFFKFNFK